MGAFKKTPTEGGSGGKRGHSNMEHWVHADEIKAAARTQRRIEDRREVIVQTGHALPFFPMVKRVSSIATATRFRSERKRKLDSFFWKMSSNVGVLSKPRTSSDAGMAIDDVHPPGGSSDAELLPQMLVRSSKWADER
jgi:hypothetical protein